MSDPLHPAIVAAHAVAAAFKAASAEPEIVEAPEPHRAPVVRMVEAPVAALSQIPAESKTQSEIEYGRQKVQEHADRARMLEGKRERGDEAAHVADAKAQNSEL